MLNKDDNTTHSIARPWLALAASLCVLAGCSDDSATSTPATPAAEGDPAPAAETQSAVDAAQAALGMDELDSITYNGSAWRVRNSFRQTLTASPPWPERDEISNYQRTLDLNAPASRATGETFASNLFLEPPVAGTYTQNVAPGQTAWGQQLEIWLTPWGFLEGAERYGAEEGSATVDGESYTTVSWQSPQDQTSPSGMQYTVVGYLDDENLPRRIETWVEDAFMGDMQVVALYDDYQDMNGLLVPTTMEQQRGGGGIFGVSVASAEANPANAEELLTIPAAANGGPGAGGGGGQAQPAPDPASLAQELAEGVHLINGGYVALVVEFTDHVAVFEAGQSEARGEQILAAVQALHPDKEIRYLINSHPHSDHTAGMLPFVREGATVVTHENNVEFLDMAMSTPRTLLGEETLDPQFMPAGSVTVLEDDSRRLELHHIPNLHSDGMLVAYLPNERVLFQADFTLPQPGAQANPFVIDLANYVDQNGLDFDQYLAVHAAQAPQTKADLMATIGK